MTGSSCNLIRLQENNEEYVNVGRFEHGNKFHVLGMDDDEASEGGSSLEEPLFDEGQEISDDEDDEMKQDIEGAGDQAAGGNAENGGDVVPDPPNPHEVKRMRSIAKPLQMTRAQRRQHDDEGHANYHPGCEFCVRAKGLPDRHTRGKTNDADELHKDEEMPTVSFDFCFLSQSGQAKAWDIRAWC